MRTLRNIFIRHYYTINVLSCLAIILIMVFAPVGYKEYRHPVYVYQDFPIQVLISFVLIGIVAVTNYLHNGVGKYSIRLIWLTNLMYLAFIAMLSYNVYTRTMAYIEEESGYWGTGKFGTNYVYWAAIISLVLLCITISKLKIDAMKND